MTSFQKCRPIRDKKWRKYVASLPCLGCGIEGSSQAAHAWGFGLSMKASDHDCIALCCARPGVAGCHAGFDETRTLPEKSRTETRWAIVQELERLAKERAK